MTVSLSSILSYFLMFEHGTMEMERKKIIPSSISRAFADGDSRFVYHRAAYNLISTVSMMSTSSLY